MVENKKGKSKRKEGLEVSRLSSTENKGVEAEKVLVLKPLGLEMDYSDWVDDSRDTWVTLFFSRFDPYIRSLCKKDKCHNVDDPKNIKKVAVVIGFRTLTFSNVGLYDNGLTKNGYRQIEMHTDDFVQVSDHHMTYQATV